MNFNESFNKAIEVGMIAVQPIVDAKQSIAKARSIEVLNIEQISIDNIEIFDTQEVTELAADIIDNGDFDKSVAARFAMLHFNLGRTSVEDTLKKLKNL